nr:MAG TPA: hypothetical protein [Caudoviricetes sp.]
MQRLAERPRKERRKPDVMGKSQRRRYVSSASYRRV